MDSLGNVGFKINQGFSLNVINSSNDPNSCWAPKREDSGVFYYTLPLGNTQKKGFITLFLDSLPMTG
jgi:hypothetical protein